MIGACHCAAVTWALAKQPQQIVDCNCSICSKLGVLWAHAPVGEVTLTSKTIAYIRKDLSALEFHSCQICGCSTHWKAVDPSAEIMAVNCRLTNPGDLADIPIRHFDGADTWTFLD